MTSHGSGCHFLWRIPVRVLVIDDDSGLTTALERHLANLCRFEVAHTLKSANRHMGIASTPFDAFVVDVGLSDGNGLEWLKVLRSHGERARATIMSAQTDDGLAEAAAEVGAAFIQKAGRGDQLAASLRTFFERVATEKIVRPHLRRYALERGFSDAEIEVFEAALWVRRGLIPAFVGKEESTIKTQVHSMNRKTGLHSVEAALNAALTRAMLATLNARRSGGVVEEG